MAVILSTLVLKEFILTLYVQLCTLTQRGRAFWMLALK